MQLVTNPAIVLAGKTPRALVRMWRRWGQCHCGLMIACLSWLFVHIAAADPPSVSYIFPAGGQKGTTVPVRIGGHNLHGQAGFEMLGSGVEYRSPIRETNTIWFEGPVIPLPASQQVEDYPKDHAGQISIAPDTDVGIRYWRVWTSQGATTAQRFVVGDLPEIVEQEVDGDALPVSVQLPLTINGRIFPREDVDVWTFKARAGERITCEVASRRLGSPLEARLVVTDAFGNRLVEAMDLAGSDPRLHFCVPADGTYQLRVDDLNMGGLQHYVYRLTLSTHPYVTSIYPLGGRRGMPVRFEVLGFALEESGNLLSSHRSHRDGREMELTLPSGAGGTFWARFPIRGSSSNPVLLELSDLAERLEIEPNDGSNVATEAVAPGVCNGRINKPGDKDFWVFTTRKDNVLEVVVDASRAGSPLDSVISILDVAGKELASNDDMAAEQSDSRISFKPPGDGNYYVKVQERFAKRGGETFSYRLRIEPAEGGGDFELKLSSDSVTVVREMFGISDEDKKRLPPSKPAQLRIDAVRRGGFSGEIEIAVEGLPSGVVVKNTKIASGQAGTDLSFVAAPETKIGVSHLKIMGKAQVDRNSIVRQAVWHGARGEPPIGDVLLAVAMPTPFKCRGEYLLSYAHRGSVFRRRYYLDRVGFNGPLTVRLADRQVRHLQGVHGPALTVPGLVNEFEYPISLPPWMEVGRTSRSAVMALAVVKDHDGSEHTVSYSSGEQNDQIIAVVAPGLVSIETNRRSILAQSGSKASVHVRTQRDSSLANKSVQIELVTPAHFRGVRAEPLSFSAEQSSGSFVIEFGADLGPFNKPALIRATVGEGTDKYWAEAPIEFVTTPNTGTP